MIQRWSVIRHMRRNIWKSEEGAGHTWIERVQEKRDKYDNIGRGERDFMGRCGTEVHARLPETRFILDSRRDPLGRVGKMFSKAPRTTPETSHLFVLYVEKKYRGMALKGKRAVMLHAMMIRSGPFQGGTKGTFPST